MVAERRFSPIISSLRRSRREKPPSEDEIQAAAVRVNLDNAKLVAAVLKQREKWQEQVIDDIDVIGELQFGVSVLSQLISRVTFFAATMPDEMDAEPVRLTGKDDDEKKAIATVDRLGNIVNRAEIFHDIAFNLLSTGECFLVCFAARPEIRDREQLVAAATDEHWSVRSIRDVEKVTIPGGRETIKTFDILTQRVVTLDQTGDTFLRIYNADPFRHSKATSHLKAILGPAEELLWWDAAASAAAKNRMTMTPLVAVPSNIEATSVLEGEDAKMSGSQRFITRLVRIFSRAASTPGDPASAVPNVISYPKNDQQKSGIEILEFDRPGDELLESRTDRSLLRMEQGINLPKGVISGLGDATSWGSGAIEASVFRDHAEPAVVLICSALTSAFLVPILALEETSEPSRFFMWFDASNLILHKDRAMNAMRAYELGECSGQALRRELGLSERDKPSEEERQATIEFMQAVRSSQKQGIVENPSEVTEVPTDPDAAPKQNPLGKRTSEQDHSGPMRGKGQKQVAASANGHRDGNDTLALHQLQVLCDEQCRRALERAGNKLRSRANKNTTYKNAIRTVKPYAVASTLGREAVTKLGSDDLFDGAFDDLGNRVMALLPDTMAIDTLRPIASLTADLRLICAEYLFKPPGHEPIVPIEIIAKSLQAT